MIVYTFNKEHKYVNFAQSVAEVPAGKRTAYVNITNRCNCSCTFCLRSLKTMSSVNNLWLEQEPTVAEAIADFELQDWSLIREVVFCGFGEPTMRLDDLLELMRYVKAKDPAMKTRLNTNGLSDLEYGRETAPLFAGLLDTISISLNASTPQQYLQLTRNRFGEVSYPGMLDFAVKAKQYVPNVVMTVVDNIGAAEIAACREICADRGLVLRVRPYEAN